MHFYLHTVTDPSIVQCFFFARAYAHNLVIHKFRTLHVCLYRECLACGENVAQHKSLDNYPPSTTQPPPSALVHLSLSRARD